MNSYICKIPSVIEMNIKWDYEINNANNKDNWIKWKKENINNFEKGFIVPYYGILDGKIICECTAAFSPLVIQNPENLVDDKTAYLTGFRTLKEYEGQGYFSKLYKFMIDDLKKREYEKVTLGVEPHEEKNKNIYFKYGFNEHIKNGKEVYPDGTTIDVEYYLKHLN